MRLLRRSLFKNSRDRHSKNNVRSVLNLQPIFDKVELAELRWLGMKKRYPRLHGANRGVDQETGGSIMLG